MQLKLPSPSELFIAAPDSVNPILFVENMVVVDHKLHVTILRNFHVHTQKRLVHFSDTSTMERETEHFAMGNNLSQLIDLPTCIYNRSGDYVHTLEFTLAFVLSNQILQFFLLLDYLTIVLLHLWSVLPLTNLYLPQGILRFTIQPTETTFVTSESLMIGLIVVSPPMFSRVSNFTNTIQLNYLVLATVAFMYFLLV